jgi:hypothetical protein
VRLLEKKTYFTSKAFEKVLEHVVIRYAPEGWQTVAGQERISNLLAEFRQQAPAQANIPPIMP